MAVSSAPWAANIAERNAMPSSKNAATQPRCLSFIFLVSRMCHVVSRE